MAEYDPYFVKRGPIATKLKVYFNNLICPPHINIIYGLHIAVAFEVFRWMVVTGDPYRSKGYPSAGVRELLGHHVGCVNVSSVDGFSDHWKKDLRSRFLSALLDPYTLPSIEKWRKDYKIQVNKNRIVHIRYRKPMFRGDISSNTCGQLLDRILCNTAGSKLKKQLNDSHPKAAWVQYATLVPSLYYKRWVIVLHYGHKNDSSSWSKTITIQGKKELFTDFLLRTAIKLKNVYIDCHTWKTTVKNIHRNVPFEALLEK